MTGSYAVAKPRAASTSSAKSELAEAAAAPATAVAASID